MMRPRILIFSTAYLPHIGGSELAIHHIAQRLTGFDIDLVTGRLAGSESTMERIGRVRVFRAGGRWSRLTLVLPKLLLPLAMALTALRLMRRHNYALLHAYQASQAAAAAVVVRLLHASTPLILTLQEGKELDRQSFLTRWARASLLRRADAITVISNHLARYARRYSSVPVHIIPNGVDVAFLQSPDVARDQHLVITVSRLVEKNNVANLIRAMALVCNRFPDARLVVVGGGHLRKELVALASELRLSGAIDFAGTVPHEKLGSLLASAGVFARPSLSEGLGSAFLEAMAARVPVVASAVGGIPDIVHHGETGLMCDPQNPEDIARSIVQLMTDDVLREHVVATAHEMVRTTYNWNSIAHRMDEVYRQMIHDKDA